MVSFDVAACHRSATATKWTGIIDITCDFGIKCYACFECLQIHLIEVLNQLVVLASRIGVLVFKQTYLHLANYYCKHHFVIIRENGC